MTTYGTEGATGKPVLPVSILTGFLGSGKTTLLNALLSDEDMVGTAVIINEFGDVGLDHHFVDVSDVSVAILPNGCLCCIAADDLSDTLTAFFSAQATIARPLRRLVIETSGLANPAPVAQLVMSLPLTSAHLTFEKVIATVDALHISQQLDRHVESGRQIAFADAVIVTKSDLIDEVQLDGVYREIARYNHHAPIVCGKHGSIEFAGMFPGVQAGGAHTLSLRERDTSGYFADTCKTKDCYDPACDHNRRHTHSTGIRTFSIVDANPVDWGAFSSWLRRLRRQHGDSLLRVKGIVNARGRERPVAIHAIHHVLHPVRELVNYDGWDQRTSLVFITDAPIEETIRGQWADLRLSVAG